jgi:hypothetical protein
MRRQGVLVGLVIGAFCLFGAASAALASQAGNSAHGLRFWNRSATDVTTAVVDLTGVGPTQIVSYAGDFASVAVTGTATGSQIIWSGGTVAPGAYADVGFGIVGPGPSAVSLGLLDGSGGALSDQVLPTGQWHWDAPQRPRWVCEPAVPTAPWLWPWERRWYPPLPPEPLPPPPWPWPPPPWPVPPLPLPPEYPNFPPQDPLHPGGWPDPWDPIRPDPFVTPWGEVMDQYVPPWEEFHPPVIFSASLMMIGLEDDGGLPGEILFLYTNTSNIPVPEPLTALTVLAGVGGLIGYLRARRSGGGG